MIGINFYSTYIVFFTHPLSHIPIYKLFVCNKPEGILLFREFIFKKFTQ